MTAPDGISGGEIRMGSAYGSTAARSRWLGSDIRRSTVAGVGHSPVDRRWDEVSMDKSLGAYSILACQKAMDEAGVTADQIDGVICCDSHIAGGSGGSASQWAPRPYFAPP